MQDSQSFYDSTKHREAIKQQHFIWEKKYLDLFFAQIRNGINENILDKTLEEFKKNIPYFLQGNESQLECFLKYLQSQRNSLFLFNNEEMIIVKKNQEFKELIIKFHESVDILVQIELGKLIDEHLKHSFQQLDSNIQVFLFLLLESILQQTKWEEKIQILKELINQKEVEMAKITIQRQQIIQSKKKIKTHVTVLIIGAVGTGKSRLAQQLFVGLNGGQETIQFFNEGSRIEGVTKDINRQQFIYQQVIVDLIDTPGCGDMETGLRFVFQELLRNSTKIDLIIFCMNAQILRLHRDDLCFLSIIQGIFKCNWENFFICLNFMELINKEQVKFQNITASFEKRLEIKLPQSNLIIENDPSLKLRKIQQIIDGLIINQDYNSFKLKYIPDFRFINMRLNKYQV